MLSNSLHAVITGILLLSSGVALGEAATVTLSMSNSAGSDLTSPANELFGTIVTFTCTFPEMSISATEFGLYKVHLQLQIGGVWETQGFCQYDNSNFPTGKVVIGPNFLNLTESDLSCDGSAEYRVSLPLSTHTNYRCHFENPLTNVDNFSAAVVLKSHSQPKKPVFTPNTIEVREGDSLSITCESEAYPAPELEIKLDGAYQAGSPATQAEGSQLLQTNTVTWDLQSASRDANGDELMCRVMKHPYGTVATITIMNVIYGPDADQGEMGSIRYNKNSGDPPLLEANMDAYPALKYTWYTGDTRRGDGDTYQVASSDIDTIQSFPHDLVYRVVGVNSMNGQQAEKTFTVEVVNDKVTTARGPLEGTTEAPGGLLAWHIALIVVAAVLLIIIILVTVIVVKKRKTSSSSAKKSKAAQARRSSDERTDTSKYQSSTTSLARQDNTGRAASYHENPTLPMEYRYSQGNVEQYAPVIDDMPRSRKPIALEDMEMFDANTSAPMFDEAPPAYAADMNAGYRMEPNYSTYSPSYGSTYGAAC